MIPDLSPIENCRRSLPETIAYDTGSFSGSSACNKNFNKHLVHENKIST